MLYYVLPTPKSPKDLQLRKYMQLHNYMASSITGWKSSFGLGVKLLGKETWLEKVPSQEREVESDAEGITLKRKHDWMTAISLVQLQMLACILEPVLHIVI